MMFWFFSLIFMEDAPRGRFEDFGGEKERYLFQQKKYVLGFNDEVFGVLNSFFSLSDVISFEMDIQLKYLINNKKQDQKVYGKIKADRKRMISELLFILKRKEKTNDKIELTSIRGVFEGDLLKYEINDKDSVNKKIKGDIKIKGKYWLVNPVFPFGRNMKQLKETKRTTAFYNPVMNKFERIKYVITNEKSLINGQNTVKVQASLRGVSYDMFLTDAGELLKVLLPSGFYIKQVPMDDTVKVNNYLNVEKAFNEIINKMSKKK